MASIARAVLSKGMYIQRMYRIPSVVVNSTRKCGTIDDWKPGPPPKTKEEREAAARKYNLIPEDYESHPETEGFGDYPMLPRVGQDARDPFEDFDMHYRRRNFGETLHVDYDAMTAERNDPNETTNIPPWEMRLVFFLFLAIPSVIYYITLLYDIRICQPVKPKQYPGPGKVHYTFEPAHD
jgi:NADH dehydrogenase (ubiquinone) 1 beta subcomplex subunit 8